jgi:methylmalonyl-CoA mutase cobalamin-binding domain/chain
LTKWEEGSQRSSEKGAEEIFVFGGGIIPEEGLPTLFEVGIKAIFPPGESIQKAVD